MKQRSSGRKSLPTWTLGASLGLVLFAAACEESAETTTPTPGQNLYCWDLNSNGRCNPFQGEDRNGDGECTVDDCWGADGDAGPPGIDGLPGVDGIDGIPGASCWDSNANGTCDTDAEDFNDDGVCDALDCVGLTNGTLEGTVTNALSGNPLEDVTITIVPAAAGPLTTPADGSYSASLPTGFYTVTFSKDDFATIEQAVPIAAAQTTTVDVALEPDGPVIVSAGADTTANPGDTLTLDPVITITDDSTVQDVTWQQLSGVDYASLVDNGNSVDVTFEPVSVYKDALVAGLTLQDRWMVVPINPEALEQTKTATFQVTVVTSSGSYTDTVKVTVAVPWVVNPGLRNVPRSLPVLLQGAGAGPWTWTVVDANAAAVAVTDETTRFPYFTPTTSGAYTATETTSGTVITLTAGTWSGAIEGQDSNGLPIVSGCAEGCHHGALGTDAEIFGLWREGGHATIFSETLNEAGGYHKEGCFSCHAVGWSTGAANGGMDDASDYDGFMQSGLVGSPDAANWTEMLASYPAAAKLANVQCDNCHGPSGSAAHNSATETAQRDSLASEVCATCHGDVDRHGRFQQWQQSAHASYTQALARGTVENGGTNTNRCGRCHAAQAFVRWSKQSNLTLNLQGATGNATNAEMTSWGMTVARVEPITCATCHDPHMVGDSSGNPNAANVRVVGDLPTLPGGFAAPAMGRGAICALCHNTIGGRHDDTTGLASFSMPHGSAQTDVLLGQGAYFVPPGLYRSPHSYIEDTCAECHMAKTPPPAEFSYNHEGTNHTFAPSAEMCGECHGDLTIEGTKNVGEALLDQLHAGLSTAAVARLNAEGANGGLYIKAITVDGTAASSTSTTFPAAATVLLDTLANPVVSVDFIEYRGQGGLALTLTSNLQWTTSGGVPVDSNVVWVEFRGLWNFAKTSIIYTLTGNYAKGVYNYLLLHADKSEAIHNPGFYNAVVGYTLSQDLSI